MSAGDPDDRDDPARRLRRAWYAALAVAVLLALGVGALVLWKMNARP